MESVLGVEVDVDEIRVARADRAGRALLPEASISTDVCFSPQGEEAGADDETVSRWLWALGRESYHPSIEQLARWEGWRLEDDGDGLAALRAAGVLHSATSLAERVLERVCTRAMACGARGGDAVMSAPAGLGERQVEALTAAACAAGIQVARVLVDTTAVALGAIEEDFWGSALVLKLGQGHAEAAVCDLAPGMLRVGARVFDPHGGADRVDHRLCDWLVERAERDGVETARTPTFRRWALARVRELRLAEFSQRSVVLPIRASARSRPTWELPPGMILHNGRLQAERTTALCREVLKRSDKQPLDLARVVVVGHGARSARVREALRGLLPRGVTVAPLGAAALGAASYAVALRGEADACLLQEEPTHRLDALADDDAPFDAREAIGRLAARMDRHTPRPQGPLSPPPRRPRSRPPVVLLRPPSPPDDDRLSTPVPPPGASPRRQYGVRESTSSEPATPLSPPRRGVFRGVLTPGEILGLPSVFAAPSGPRAPFTLPSLLVALEGVREHTGRVVLRHHADEITLVLQHGSPAMTVPEQQRARRAFLWESGEYDVLAEPVAPHGRECQSVVAFVCACVRPVLLGFTALELMQCLGGRLDRAPVVTETERARGLALLTPDEQRRVEQDVTGQFTLREMVESNPQARFPLLSAMFMLELAQAVQWGGGADRSPSSRTTGSNPGAEPTGRVRSSGGR